MYDIAIWITENHDKLPKIESKQGSYLPTELVLTIDICLLSDKQPSKYKHPYMAYHVLIMVVVVFVESYVSFFFALGQLLDRSRCEMAISFVASFILGAAATWSLKWYSFDNILVWYMIYYITV